MARLLDVRPEWIHQVPFEKVVSACKKTNNSDAISFHYKRAVKEMKNLCKGAICQVSFIETLIY